MFVVLNRTSIINSLILKNGYKSYLEIGLSDPNLNYNHIICEHKECCDPFIQDGEFVDQGTKLDFSIIEKVLTYHMTSDEMFAKMPSDKKYDIIFIDGMHTKEQVIKDVENALHHLNENGTIICHDNLPINEISQRVPRVSQAWFGDVWKATYSLIHNNPTLDIKVVDTDCGCSVIKYHNPQNLNFNLIDVNYNDIFENRIPDMNIISQTQFIEQYILL